MCKRIGIVLLACILCLCMLLSGCSVSLFEKTEYERQEDVYTRVLEKDTVFTKADIFDELGFPGVYEVDGNTVYIPFSEREEHKEAIFRRDSMEWQYTCCKYNHSSYPYRLTVCFDETGKIVMIRFSEIPGG